jgi:hypothetical protein
MSDHIEDIVAMARAAYRDDRLADGALYGKLADEIDRLRSRVEELENLRLVVVSETADAKTLDRDDAICTLQMLRRAAMKETAP